MTDAEAKSLFEEGQPAGTNDGLYIKYFADKVAMVHRSKPMIWDYRAPNAAKAKVQTRMEAEVVSEENVTKFKKSIEALKLELEEKNKEIKSLNLQIGNSTKERIKLENELKLMSAKLVSKYDKPPQAMREESLTMGGLDEI